MKKYSIGIDFGTLSARAVLADVSSGEIMASDIYEYGHGVIEQQMPDGTRLPEGFALQDPGDYLEAVAALIPGLLSLAGIAADQGVPRPISRSYKTIRVGSIRKTARPAAQAHAVC